MLDRFKRLGLKGLFEALLHKDIEIILESGLSYQGELTKVFELSDSKNKSKSVYVNLSGNGQTYLICVNNVSVITKG